MRADVRAGAELLVNLAHDGWFGDTAARAQHFHAAQLRAVESRRYLLRATSVPATIVATVPLLDARTVYGRDVAAPPASRRASSADG